MDQIPSVTQYVHPTTKQCNYTPNLSNYYTKAEIDSKLSELEGSMPPSLVGTYSLGSITVDDNGFNIDRISVSKCDYIEVNLFAGFTPRSETISKGSSFEFAYYSSGSNAPIVILIGLSNDGTYVCFDLLDGSGFGFGGELSLQGASVKCYG